MHVIPSLCCLQVIVSLENIRWQKPAFRALKRQQQKDVGDHVICKYHTWFHMLGKLTPEKKKKKRGLFKVRSGSWQHRNP